MNLGLVRAGIDNLRTIQKKKGGYTFGRVLRVVSANKPQWVEELLSGLSDLPVHTKGQPVAPQSRQKLFEIPVSPINFASAYEYDVYDDEDDQYGEQVAKIPGLFSNAERRTMNRYGVYLHNRAFTTGATIYDGQLLASTAHTSASGVSTRSNRPTVLQAMSSYQMEVQLQELRKTLDPLGDPMEFGGPVKCIGNATLQPLADRILTATGLAQTNDNDPNWVKGQVRFELQWHISSDTFWSLQQADETEHGLTMFTWGGVKFHEIPLGQNLGKALIIRRRFRPICLQWEGTRFCNS